MQTYLVHTRQLRRLNSELGLRAAIGFHALMGGLIGSALVHPLFYLLLVFHWLSGNLLAPSESSRRGDVDDCVHQPRLRLRRLDPGRGDQRVAPAPAGPGRARAADADLLAAHLVCRLSRPLPARPRSLPVGKDRARRGLLSRGTASGSGLLCSG